MRQRKLIRTLLHNARQDEAVVRRLTQQERDVVRGVVRRLKTEFDADQVVLYGSAARGEMDRESDIDLLAVLPNADWETKKKVCDVCFEAELEIGRIISVLCVSKEAAEKSALRSSPLLATVRREGVPQ